MMSMAKDWIGADESAARRLAAIVESSDDAIISKTVNGTIATWNAGASRVFGYDAEEAVGKPVTILIPSDRLFEEANILARIRRGERIEHYETVRQRKDGGLIDVSLTVSPILDEAGNVVGASKIARDITQRKSAERQAALQAKRLEKLDGIAKLIARELDLPRVVQTVTDAATELSGAQFGAFFYNIADERGERYTLYTLSGAPREAFERFGMPRNTEVFAPTFMGSGVVRSDDIRQDPRYGKNAPYHGMPAGHLPVVSYLAVPVIGHDGEVLGGLFFGHDQPGRFTQDSQDNVVGIAAHAAIAINNGRAFQAAQQEIARRRKAEEAQELLLQEIKHRVKNTLGIVQAIANQTFAGAPAAERSAFGARLRALGEAHDLLTRTQDDAAAVQDIVNTSLAPFQEHRRQRFDVAGPAENIGTSNAMLLALVLHELATNAVKYGALSKDFGHVTLRWDQTGPGRRTLRFVWREEGGPSVMPPSHRGFGSNLIQRALAGANSQASIEFAPRGVICSFDLEP